MNYLQVQAPAKFGVTRGPRSVDGLEHLVQAPAKFGVTRGAPLRLRGVDGVQAPAKRGVSVETMKIVEAMRFEKH